MADTHRERAALATLLADNTAGGISAQDHRDQLLSSLLRNVTTYTALTPTIDDDDVVVLLDGTSNTVAAALPAVAGATHRILFIKAINTANAVTLTGDVEGGAGYSFVTALDAVILACNGSEWYILGEFTNA